MLPPPVILDSQAISGITGSISIACWIVVFAPQISQNFIRKSSDGLSLTFIILWLAGDVFNVLGAVLQGLLPTMIILAIYYTLADIVLLWQCLVYGNGDDSEKKTDLTHLSPATPINDDILEEAVSPSIRSQDLENSDSKKSNYSSNGLTSILLNTLMVSLVLLSGIIGWYISYLNDLKNDEKHQHHNHDSKNSTNLVFDPLAQFFGWLCAILYLGSRIPQIVLNYERKSTDGISFMFFLFACLGNLTYVISIISIDMSWYYLWVNSSWLAGSLGTLALDFTIFVQFFLYNKDDELSFTDSEATSCCESNHERLLNGNNNESYGSTTSNDKHV
ncbi:RTC2 [Candida pseudojiufengensis]|uniref:RTC2 n=1 Tax=Candida pseudojiufengensis TaxID=497109 RepID=UPI002223F072|nr:RTC2 [Candida pseudojiufengensis]KAI5967827.1 RTC2 [Candida pseudojiufengensis]